jgi:hypothetical protein
LVFGVYKKSTFTLFDIEVEKLVDIEVPNQEYGLRIYHIPSNASLLDYIQVRKVMDNKENVIGNFERYDSLVSYSLADTALELRLINTVQMRPKVDTLILKLNYGIVVEN